MALTDHQTGWRPRRTPAGRLVRARVRAVAACMLALTLVSACTSEPETPTNASPEAVTIGELMTNAFTWDRTNPVVRDPDRQPQATLAYLATRALYPSAPSASVAALSLPMDPAGTAELAWAIRRHGGDTANSETSRLLGSVAPDGLGLEAVAAGALALAGTDAGQIWCRHLRTAATSSSRVMLARSRCGLVSAWPSTLPKAPADVDDATAESVYNLAFDGDDAERPRATDEARTFLEEVNAGETLPSDRALAMLSLAARQQPSGNAQVRLRQMELFAGTLPSQAVPDAFAQVMALRAWRAVGGPPEGVEEAFTEAVKPLTGSMDVESAILHAGVGQGLPAGTTITVGADEDAITAYGLTAVVAGATTCAATKALRPPPADLRKAAEQPMAVAPNRTVMLALGARLERQCGHPEVASAVAQLAERQRSDTTQASDQPYRLWGELEATCVLDGRLTDAERGRAKTVSDRYLTEVVKQPAMRFGVGDVYGATRLAKLARSCEGAWWQHG